MSRSQPDDQETLPILVLGNKIDLEMERQITKGQGEEYCSESGGNLIFMETSAKDAINVEDGFNKLAKEAIKV